MAGSVGALPCDTAVAEVGGGRPGAGEQRGRAWAIARARAHGCLAATTQVDLAHRGDAGLAAKLPSLARRLGEAHVAAGQLEEAEVSLCDVLAHDMPLSERLPVLALLADVQLREDSAETEAKMQAKLRQSLADAGGDASKVRRGLAGAARSGARRGAAPAPGHVRGSALGARPSRARAGVRGGGARGAAGRGV